MGFGGDGKGGGVEEIRGRERLTGAKLANPVMAPEALDAILGRRKSMKPSMTRKEGAFRGSFRGYVSWKRGVVTAVVMRVSLPTLPQLRERWVLVLCLVE